MRPADPVNSALRTRAHRAGAEHAADVVDWWPNVKDWAESRWIDVEALNLCAKLKLDIGGEGTGESKGVVNSLWYTII